jgi:hypothetical protein
MSSVPKPRCAKGEDCYHVRKLRSEKPATVAHQGDLCEKCVLQGPSLEETPEGHRELFRVARALLDHRMEGEQTIIPTLVLAALSDMDQQYERVGRAIVESYGKVEAREELTKAFLLSFEGIVPSNLVSGVPLVERLPLGLAMLPDETDRYVPLGREALFKGIKLVVYEGGVTPAEVAEQYEKVLRLFSLPYTEHLADVAYERTDVGLLMVVRPAEEDPDLRPIMRSGNPNIFANVPEGPPRKRQPAFPALTTWLPFTKGSRPEILLRPVGEVEDPPGPTTSYRQS